MTGSGNQFFGVFSDTDNYSRSRKRRNRERLENDYKTQEPNSTIMVRGMAYHLTENDVRQRLTVAKFKFLFCYR